MYWIEILNKTTGENWKEEFTSYYLFKKRVTKIQFSKKLVITSRSNFIT